MRATTWISPKIAVGSGGMFGRGYLHGTQTALDYVPEQHTDFIFTVVGEEFGFMGSVFVLSLFALLLWRAIRIASLSKDPFGTYLATGVASMFAIQMFVNVGMVIGIMPITGIPLPFLELRGHDHARELRRRGHPAQRAHAPIQVGRRTARQGSGRIGCETIHRKVEPSGPVLLQHHVAVHRAGRHAGERESQPDALMRPGVELFPLFQRFEDPVERAAIDAMAVVDDADLGPVDRAARS